MSKPTRLDAVSRLVLIRAKVERAKQNLLDLKEILDRFYGHEIRANKHTKTKLTGTPDSFKIPMDALTAAGDITGNLWGALDHLCYQLIDAYNPALAESVLEKSAFPFAKDVAGYEEAKSRRKIELMDPKAVILIDHLKPYGGGNDVLRLLHELNNINKHRILLTVGTCVYASADWIGGYSPGTGFLLINTDPHFAGVYDPTEVHEDLQGSLGKAPTQFNAGGSNALLPTMHYFVDFIDDIIDSFLPFLESQ